MFGNLVKHLNGDLCLRIVSTWPEQLCWVGALAWSSAGSDFGGTLTVSLHWNVVKNPFWQRNSDDLKRADT